MKLGHLVKILVVCALGVVFVSSGVATFFARQLYDDARTINLAGLMRGMTQRAIKLEFARRPDASEPLIAKLDTLVDGLGVGSAALGVPAATDPTVIGLLEEARWRWDRLKGLMREARENPEARVPLLAESEEYFALTDKLVGEIERWSTAKHSVMRVAFVVASALSVCLVLGAYVFVRRRIIRPIDQITSILPSIGAGDFSQRVGWERRDEFGTLAGAIDAMVERLHVSYRQLQSVIDAKTLTLNERLAELHRINIELEQKRVAMLNLLEDAQEAERESDTRAKQLTQANRKVSVEKERAEGILRFLQSIGEVVYATDTERRVVFINDAGAALMGKNPERIAGTHTSDHIMFETGENQKRARYYPIRETLATQKRVIFPPHTFCLHGEKRLPISGTAAPILGTDGVLLGAIVSFMDDTAKFEFEKSKDRFLSVAAHQLRTPLGSMRWAIEFLEQEKLGKLPPDVKDAISQLAENNRRMLSLVNELLDVVRIEEGVKQEEPVETDLVELVREVIKSLAGRATQAKMSLQASFPDKPLPPLRLTRKHVAEAIENLIINALQYNREGKPIRVTVQLVKNAVHISVADQGIGIPQADQARIFSKFYRAKNAMRKFTDGTGLGLSVVKSYMEENGGTVSFESEENVGTTFTLFFPVARSNDHPHS